MIFTTALLALGSALVASAADIKVLVGDAGSLAFSPPSVAANVGDNLIFEFRAKNHSVTQSSFAAPCTWLTTPAPGINSGFQAVSDPNQLPQWNVTVNVTTPLWFYCAQLNPADHCKAGMVFAVNPTADKSFDAFQLAANNSEAMPSGMIMPPFGSAASSSAMPSGMVMSSTGAAKPSATGNTTSNSTNSTTGAASGALKLSGSTAGVLAGVAIFAAML